MSSSAMSPEVRKYIDKIVAQRNKGGVLTEEECQSILKYAAESKSDIAFGIGYYYFAENYMMKEDMENTMHCLTECVKCFRTEEYPLFLARTYNMMGAVAGRKNNRVAAMNYYYTGLQYAEKHRLHYVVGMLTMNIAAGLMRMNQDGKAVEYFERAIESFRQAESTPQKSRYLASCMMHCGTCCLRMGEKEKAYGFLEEIQQLRREKPEDSYPIIGIKVFEAECLVSQGKGRDAVIYVDEILEEMEKADSLGGMDDSLSKMAELLLNYEDYDRLERLLKAADALGLEKKTALSMEMFPYRRECLLRKRRTEEYINCTEKYFTTYEQDRINNRQVTARILELQDKVRDTEKDQEKMRAANRELEALALYDSMTNLANRTLINEYLSQKFGEAKQESKIFGVELLDIDYFKRYNDRYGHLAGDACIEAVASALRELESDRVFCGRYGGDEFVVIYTDMTVAEIQATVERLSRLVTEKKIPHEDSGCENIVTVSQGIYAAVPVDLNREWDFSSMADKALYQAKRRGRNCWHLSTGARQEESQEGI